MEYQTQRSGIVAERGKRGVGSSLHQGWGRHCSGCRLSSFCPKEPPRDSWEPSKSRQCGLTSWNSAELLSLGDPRRCPNKQKAAGKQRPGGQGGWRSHGEEAEVSVVPGSLGLWAVGSVASSWLLESRLCATNSPHAGRPGPTTAADSGAGPLRSMACTRVNTDSHVCSLKPPGTSTSCEGYRLVSLTKKQAGL